MKSLKSILWIIAMMQGMPILGQTPQVINRPERVNWFQDLGFGLFIHWNVDVTLGAVISHSLSGASDE